MGKIADKYSDKIYLTDDNPRMKIPIKLEKILKKELKKIKIIEIPQIDQKQYEAIKNLKYW